MCGVKEGISPRVEVLAALRRLFPAARGLLCPLRRGPRQVFQLFQVVDGFLHRTLGRSQGGEIALFGASGELQRVGCLI